MEPTLWNHQYGTNIMKPTLWNQQYGTNRNAPTKRTPQNVTSNMESTKWIHQKQQTTCHKQNGTNYQVVWGSSWSIMISSGKLKLLTKLIGLRSLAWIMEALEDTLLRFLSFVLAFGPIGVPQVLFYVFTGLSHSFNLINYGIFNKLGV